MSGRKPLDLTLEREIQAEVMRLYRSPQGKQSPAQREWQRLCEVRGVGYVLGGTEAALVHLRAIGLLR